MSIRLIQNIVRQVRITGIRDSIIAIAVGLLLATPIICQWELEVVTVLGCTMFICLLLGVPIAVTLGFSAMAALYNS